MTPQEVLAYCLAKPGAYLDHPFGPDVVVVKVGVPTAKPGRIFAQVFPLKGVDSVTLNCDMMTGLFYRDLFPGAIVRGYHCPPVQQPYFNTFPLGGAVPDETVWEMIDHSYQTVLAKLPRYVRQAISEAAARDSLQGEAP